MVYLSAGANVMQMTRSRRVTVTYSGSRPALRGSPRQAVAPYLRLKEMFE